MSSLDPTQASNIYVYREYIWQAISIICYFSLEVSNNLFKYLPTLLKSKIPWASYLHCKRSQCSTKPLSKTFTVYRSL